MNRENIIIYLAQKYSGRESECFLEAKKLWYILNVEMGFSTYSPIIDSHPVWEYILVNNLIKVEHSFWMERDLLFCESFKDKGLIMVFDNSCYVCSKVYENEFNNIIFIEDIEWKSLGAEIEYDWAKRNNVPCFDLDSILHNKYNDENWVRI